MKTAGPSGRRRQVGAAEQGSEGQRGSGASWRYPGGRERSCGVVLGEFLQVRKRHEWLHGGAFHCVSGVMGLQIRCTNFRSLPRCVRGKAKRDDRGRG
jgi:hypothetical protein